MDNPRFIRVNEISVIIADYDYYADRLDDIDSWCRKLWGIERQGMTITFPSGDALHWFLLKWA